MFLKFKNFIPCSDPKALIIETPFPTIEPRVKGMFYMLAININVDDLSIPTKARSLRFLLLSS
jgi:hypothetical protein